MIRIIFSFFFLFGTNASISQIMSVDLNWSEIHQYEENGHTFPIHFIENQGIDNGMPYYFQKTKTFSAQQKVVITDVVTEPIPGSDINYYKGSFTQLPT